MLSTRKYHEAGYLKHQMLVQEILIKKSPTGFEQRWCEIECDTCHIRFERRRRGFNPKKALRHFCSTQCHKVAKSTGVLAYVARTMTPACYASEEVKQRVLEKRKQTSRNHYGVDYPWQSTQIKTQIKKTCIQKYGVDNPASSPIVKAKIDQRLLHAKGHQTRKINGSYGRSKIEDAFYAVLCEIFGIENVERQILINGWSIDFHIKSIHTFVQFDGVHWHGLDRTIDVIRASMKPVDRTILSTWERDQKQNAWFKDQHLKLVRVTDLQFKKEGLPSELRQ